MFPKHKSILILVLLIIFALTLLSVDCKRGGGRRGGTYRGSNVWGRAKSHSTSSNYDMYGNRRSKSQSGQTDVAKKPADGSSAVVSKDDGKKASAPVKDDGKKASSAMIEQETKQQSVPLGAQNGKTQSQQQQRPIGWDVGSGAKPEATINKNAGWNVGQNPPSHSGAYPNNGASNYYGTGSNYNYGNGQYPQQNHHYPQQGYSGYPQQGYSGYPQQAPHYNNMGSYNPSYGGYGGYGSHGGLGGYGGYGGYGAYANGGGGMLSSLGGNRFGKYASFAGTGGYGVGGYGRRFGGGFGMGFGKHAVRNVLIGMLVWNLVSGLTRRPYYVYNYCNNPERIPEEIPLPANIITLCPDNVTSLCAPNTAPLCTSNGTIMCVTLAQQTVPCGDNQSLKCVASTSTCGENVGEPCDEKDNKGVPSTINIPCVTNATIIGAMLDNTTIGFSGIGKVDNRGSTNLCVTTLALPQPEEEANKSVAPLCSEAMCNINSTTQNSSLVKTPNSNITTEISDALPSEQIIM